MTGIPSLKNFNFPMRMKLAVRNGLFLKPAWFEGMLFSPNPSHHQPKFLEREDYPENYYRAEFMRKFPNRPIVEQKEHTNVSYMRGIPEDNRWLKDPTVYYALRKLAYVQRGYTEKDATELVIRDFEAKKLELEYEKEIAIRQSHLTGSKRTSASDLLQQTIDKKSRATDFQTRKREIEKFLAPKKEAIRMGISPRITPRDIQPQDADFYLKYHPYDRPYFDMTSFLRYRAAELKEKIEEKLSQEQSIEGSYFARKEKKSSLSHAVQSATITSGVPKKETTIPKEFK